MHLLLAIISVSSLFLVTLSAPSAIAAAQPDYIIQIDGTDNIALNSIGETVLRVAQDDNSTDIIQAVHDTLVEKEGDLGGTISVDSGVYSIHKPMTFTVPIKLLMEKDTVLIFDYQPRGDVGILTTTAEATIKNGVFDCNKAIQTENWIHGVVINTGSEGSLIRGTEARNCSTYGNGFVMLADHSTLANVKSHHNDGDGVYLRSCDYCIVQNSLFSSNKINGIDASDQDGKLAGHTLIFNNTARWNLEGVNLDSTYYANVTDNTLKHNWIGVAEYHSTADNLYNSITNNTIESNDYGIYEQEYIPWHDPYVSDYSTITGNIMITNGHDNVILTQSTNTIVANNTFVS